MAAVNTGAIRSNSFPSSVSFGGSDPLSQVLTGVALVAAVYFTMLFAEYMYQSYLSMFRDRVEIFPNTYASGSLSHTAIQDPKSPLAKTVYTSDNQRSGIEFSYSLFCYITSDTFSNGDDKLYHILHKGYSKSYPLMGPGLFMKGNSNTLRVYMNCYQTWNNYADIDNIPIEKWVHIVVSCKGNQLYVYINGNLKTKMALSGNTPPYQNYGDIYLFSQRTITLSSTTTPSLKSGSLVFNGAAKGLASRVFYFAYALTYTEIQNLISMGPSPVMEGVTMSITPYLTDQWWTTA
jgi:Concanavalin A-like lectin/glucanases superfamily